MYELVSSFLNKADKQGGRAAAIMRLGAAEDFIRHFQVAGYAHTQTVTVKKLSVSEFSSVDVIYLFIFFFLYRAFIIKSPTANAAEAKVVLLQRYMHVHTDGFHL